MKVELAPDGRIRTVQICVWDDGVSLWRLVLTGGDATLPVFSFRSEVTPSVSYSTLPVVRAGRKVVEFNYPSVMGRRVGGREVYGGVMPHLRWFLVESGLLSVGESPIPFPSGAGELAGPSAQNPHIGRLEGRTRVDVEQDLSVLEAMMSQIPPGEIFSSDRGFVEGDDFLQLRNPLGASSLFEAKLVFLAGDSGWVTFTSLSSGTFYDWLVTERRGKHWRALLPDDADRWWKENTEVGRMQVDPDEVEIYRLLGEKLPWLWDQERFSGWVGGR